MPVEALETENVSKSANQYLTFILNDEEYGVEILNVQEIKSWGPYTPLPRSPAHVLGVINLRGAIVPIVDLRARLGLPAKEMTSTTAIIIISIEYEEKDRTVGLVVDQVSEVYQLLPENIQQSGDGKKPIDQEGYINAFGHINDKLLILINLEPIIASTLEANVDPEQ